ncbi:MAG: CDP-glycerol glycerophosphotransferase family protein [Coprobacillus sp.]
MGIQKIILNIILTIESFFISFFSIKKKRITFISLESDVLTSDFKLIHDMLDKDKYDIRLCLIHYQKNLLGQFYYFINCMKQLYLINTSHLVLLHDNNYVVSHFKRKGVTVLQVWHACGAVKKFGNVIDRTYLVANYDYVLSTSSYWCHPFSEAFSVKKENVLPLGMPRTDELYQEEFLKNSKDYLLKKYPELMDKKVVLYAPTFRGNIYKGFSAIDFNADKLLDMLGDDYVVIYKFHPLMGDYNLVQSSRVMNMNCEDTHVLFSVCDYLISDYSSIVFDYMILDKPLIFFVPDLQEYTNDLGVFVDLNSLGCPICMDENEIKNSILNYDITNMKALENIFFENQDGQSTKRIVEWIRGKMNEKSN